MPQRRALVPSDVALLISLGRRVVLVGATLKICTVAFGGAEIWWAVLVSELMCCLFGDVSAILNY